jgi:hypothetical protein
MEKQQNLDTGSVKLPKFDFIPDIETSEDEVLGQEDEVESGISDLSSPLRPEEDQYYITLPSPSEDILLSFVDPQEIISMEDNTGGSEETFTAFANEEQPYLEPSVQPLAGISSVGYY